MTQVLRGRVVTPARVLPDGVVVVDGRTIAWVGPADRAPAGLELPPAPTPAAHPSAPVVSSATAAPDATTPAQDQGTPAAIPEAAPGAIPEVPAAS